MAYRFYIIFALATMSLYGADFTDDLKKAADQENAVTIELEQNVESIATKAKEITKKEKDKFINWQKEWQNLVAKNKEKTEEELSQMMIEQIAKRFIKNLGKDSNKEDIFYATCLFLHIYENNFELPYFIASRLKGSTAKILIKELDRYKTEIAKS